MALRFCDSFDHYATAERLFKWSGYLSTDDLTIASGGRFGNCMYRPATTDNWRRAWYKTLDNQATWIMGFAFYVSSPPTSGTPHIAGLWDGTSKQIELGINSDMRLVALKNGSVMTGGTGTKALSLYTWYYIEYKGLIDNTNGGVWVRINEQDEIRLGAYAVSPVGLDTTSTANAYANRIVLGGDAGGSNGSPELRRDDFYVCDGTGSVNNDFLGDVRIQSIFPTATGNSTQWTRGGTDSGNDWSQVDDADPTEDTDYIYTSTTSNKDTFVFGNLTPTTGTVKGVQHLVYARKDDAGTRQIAAVYRPSSTDYDGATQTIGDSYTYYAEIKETSPATSSAWTISEVNGAEFGVKLVS